MLKISEYYPRELLKKGVTTDLLSLTELPSDLLNTDLYGERSEAFQAIQDRTSAAEKFIFVIPEYNGGLPGVLKTFIDACTFCGILPG